ncbi:hypothetical protein [Wielerella bovis]|uniref:hypothetical protein n=1 Tax=Wielerella bovis TaxID=2917790 RepID=UPI002019037C|nr:hypothetical protein [Wielerella bovis]MCG7657135.1 hypothetical protein [Wielerella bovis]MCG7659358.1 hypothetical protein [Wielerella bovis]ULJ60790.1 hypothetical protein MIS44_02710 [Wielerella bovis]
MFSENTQIGRSRGSEPLVSRADLFPDKSGVVFIAHATIRKHFAKVSTKTRQQNEKLIDTKKSHCRL